MTLEHEVTFWHKGNALHSDYGGGHMTVCISQDSLLKNQWILLSVNYIFIELTKKSSKKKKKRQRLKPTHTFLQDICIHTVEIKPLHPLRTYGMGGNICKWYDQWGVNTENIETSYTTQHQKANDTIKICTIT